MTLASVCRGRVERPYRVVLYGLDGVGKTTFAASAPAPIFIGAEMGTAQMDVARFPQPTCWEDVLEAVRVLGSEDHGYETVVFDTLDWIEPLAFKAVCKREGVDTIADLGYGKGYDVAADLWRSLLAYVERLQAKRGMNVIMLAHADLKKFQNPEGDDFDRYQLKLDKRVTGLVREWPDEVLFANYQTFTHEKNKRVRGISDGSRVIHTSRQAAYDAKNRHGLPDSLPLDWDEFHAACVKGAPASADDLRAGIEAVLADASDELAAQVRAVVESTGDDAAKLARILDKAKAKVGETNNDGESK